MDWGWVGWAANIASIVGLPLALVGVWVTWREAKRARTAAEQAERQVQALRELLRKVDAIQAVTTLIGTLNGIKDLHRSGRWLQALERYWAAQAELTRLIGAALPLSPVHTQAFTNIQNNLAAFEAAVEDALRPSNEELLQRLDYVGYNSAIADFVTVLNQISILLRQRLGG